MVYLDPSGTSNVTFTLFEKSNGSPYFTFKIKRKGTFEEVIFCSDDLSYAPYYWNNYDITISSTYSGLTAGVIQANPGEWVYEAYAMSNPYDLDISTGFLVENGLLIIRDTLPEYSEYDNVVGTYSYYKN